MFKLEAANNQSIPEDNVIDYPEINMKKSLFFIQSFYFLFAVKIQKINNVVKKHSEPLGRSTNISLQPKDLSPRSGPEEGGKR